MVLTASGIWGHRAENHYSASHESITHSRTPQSTVAQQLIQSEEVISGLKEKKKKTTKKLTRSAIATKLIEEEIVLEGKQVHNKTLFFSTSPSLNVPLLWQNSPNPHGYEPSAARGDSPRS